MQNNLFISTLTILTLLFGFNTLVTEAQEKDFPGPSYNHLFDIQNIEGWTVYINKEALETHPQEMKAALEHMRYQLYQVQRKVPKPALSILHQNVPIWVEYDTISIAYHGRKWLIDNGYKPPDVPTMIGYCRMKSFLGVALDQPSVVLHELAHGYDFRYLREETQSTFKPIKDAYIKADKSGRYQSVLCRYSTGAKHYGIGNEGEYFAENSEAYFGVNDFYPFVRAELKDFDPAMYKAIETAWGINRKDQKKKTDSFIDYVKNPKRKRINSYIPTSEYTKTNIQGWNVWISPELKKEKAVSDEMIKLLGYKLHMVKRYLPEDVIKTLQKTNIWMKKTSNYGKFVTYCHSEKEIKKYGLNPDMYNSIVIWNAQHFDSWESFQPSVLLNRLSMAYYDNELGDGKNAIQSAWEQAKRNQQFHSVLQFNGSHVRHPALNSARDYFAEMTEACYGFNDCYPFLRFELKEYFPDDYNTITEVYGAAPNKMKGN